jgi:beta-1,4-N-acetylglucosaminyltransferase
MIFLTVGTQFPFDRLVMTVDALLEKKIVSELVFGQIGETEYKPRNFEYTASMEKQFFDDMVGKSSAIISHAGVGTITIAMETGKPLLVMPRLSRYGEVVNDHQMLIAERFEKSGLLMAAYSEEELVDLLPKLATFRPLTRQNQLAAVVGRVTSFLKELECV